jgi:outer membrane protein with beta-barrel domain
MTSPRRTIGIFVLALAGSASTASAQSESRFVVDLGTGINPSINGNVNSGAIGTLQGQAAAILPNSYGSVYGTGVEFRFGGGYALDKASELRAMFVYQSADADLVRLGDVGASSLYTQYSDYKSFGLDLGYRRYFPVSTDDVRVFGEASLGAAWVGRINAQFAAPQSNLLFTSTDFYDATAAFTWSLSAGALFKVAERADISAQVGLRHVGGLSPVDQLVGTGLETINNDSARLTFPVVVGVRFHF